MNRRSTATFRVRLRTRLFLGLVSITLVISAGFALAMYEFVEILEKELLHHTLTRQLESLATDYKTGAAIAGRLAVSDRVFVIEPGDPASSLPAPLRSLKPGEKHTIHFHGMEFYAGRRDTSNAHIYLMLSVGTVEALERRLSAIGWVTFLGALLTALLIAVLCGRWILKPVQTLAERVTRLQPGQAAAPIARDYRNDRTMRAIAERFDELADRFRVFAEREQAFTQDASHELRTPLAVTLSTTELLLEDPHTTRQTRERARRVRDAGHRMQRIVDALLFMARGRSCHNEPAEVTAIIGDILSFYESQIQQRHITLATRMTPTTIHAPPALVDCVLHNLIENAIEHTDDGRIDIEVEPKIITIRDTGSGIEAATLRHIRAGHYRTQETAGLGIGLYLVQRICDQLNWAVDIQSATDEGTSITITLPAAQPLDSQRT